MKETKTLAEIQAQVERYARNLLKRSGYTILPDKPDKPNPEAMSPWLKRNIWPGQKGLSVVLNVVGYGRRYDGWEYELTDEDWKLIFSIPWDKEQKKFLKRLQKEGNPNLLLESDFEEGAIRYKKRRTGYTGQWINRELTRNRLPYHLGTTHQEPFRMNGYPDMIRMFKRPVPIDGEEPEIEEDET